MTAASDEQQVPPDGLVVACAPDGRIELVVGDRIGVPGMIAGACLVALLDEGSRGKARRFLALIARDGGAFDWELVVPVGADLPVLSFAGVAQGERLWIAAARRPSAIAAVYARLLALARIDPLGAPPWVGRDFHRFEDLTRLNNELVTLQRQLLRKNRELERLNDERNQLLGVAAHELRSPITALRLCCRFLESSRPPLSHNQRDVVHDMTSSCEAMSRLLDDLLDYAKIQAGHLELRRAPCDLPALVTRVVRLQQVLATQRGVRVSCPETAPVPPLWADPGKLEQVLNNLIGNAVKYSAHGQTVDVSVAQRGCRVEVAVTDHGPGIPETERQRLFQPFATSSVAPPSGEKGTGLGLAIVERIVRGHGGAVRLDSELGRGTTVTVSLPIDDHETAVRAERAPPAV